MYRANCRQREVTFSFLFHHCQIVSFDVINSGQLEAGSAATKILLVFSALLLAAVMFREECKENMQSAIMTR